MLNQCLHGTITLERSYDASPARVFAAWADAEAKARWFVGPAERWTLIERGLDFRVGGRERLKGIFGAGPVTLFEAQYHDIVPDRRIIYAYSMWHGERLLSVSLTTVELAPAGQGTRLTFTEQAAFLDGAGRDDLASRERGDRLLLELLAGALGDS
jgi:uncharacterized protein YndB with AHSA1/START domain